MRPERSSAAAPRSAASPAIRAPDPSSSASLGPQRGQALGLAWKRRLAGSSYSPRQAAQSVKPAMVVRARSYGSDVTMLRRGPQVVQLMNG